MNEIVKGAICFLYEDDKTQYLCIDTATKDSEKYAFFAPMIVDSVPAKAKTNETFCIKLKGESFEVVTDSTLVLELLDRIDK